MASAAVVPRKGTPKPDKLTDVERIFCAEYLASGQSTTEAAKAAYPNHSVPSVMATKVLARPRVKKYLGQMLQARLDSSGLSAERLLKHLENIVFMDFAELMQSTGDGAWTFRNLNDIPKPIRQMIQSVRCRTRYYDTHDEAEFEVTLMSRDKAMQNALKYLGLLGPDQVNNILIQNQTKASFSLDDLCSPIEDDVEDDIVEQKIASVGQTQLLEHQSARKE